MLEELGLGEAAVAGRGRRDRLQHLHDPREARPALRRPPRAGAARSSERDPSTVIAVGGCYAEAQRERLFELYPFVDVAFGPGSIPHLGDWLGAGGDRRRARPLRDVDERRSPATCPRTASGRFQAWVQISMGCNSTCSYCIVPAVRGREQSRRPGEIVAEVDAARRRRRARGDAARPERQLVGPRPRCPSVATEFGELLRAVRRGRRHRADPLHEPAPEGLPARRDRGDGRVRGGVRARAPAAAVGLDADPQGDAAHVRARALPRLVERAARGDPRPRARRPTSSSASPARPRTTSRETLAVVEEVGFDGAFTFVYSPAAGHRGGRDARSGARGGQARADRAARRGRPAHRAPSGTRSGSAGSRRCSSRARAAPTPRSCAAARAATRPSTSRATRAPGELVPVLIEGATSTTLRGGCGRRRA